MRDIQGALETFEGLEDECLYDLILGLSEDQPQLFIDLADALESVLMRDIIEELRLDTHNGYPLYPELQYDD